MASNVGYYPLVRSPSFYPKDLRDDDVASVATGQSVSHPSMDECERVSFDKLVELGEFENIEKAPGFSSLFVSMIAIAPSLLDTLLAIRDQDNLYQQEFKRDFQRIFMQGLWQKASVTSINMIYDKVKESQGKSHEHRLRLMERVPRISEYNPSTALKAKGITLATHLSQMKDDTPTDRAWNYLHTWIHRLGWKQDPALSSILQIVPIKTSCIRGNPGHDATKMLYPLKSLESINSSLTMPQYYIFARDKCKWSPNDHDKFFPSLSFQKGDVTYNLKAFSLIKYSAKNEEDITSYIFHEDKVWLVDPEYGHFFLQQGYFMVYSTYHEFFHRVEQDYTKKIQREFSEEERKLEDKIIPIMIGVDYCLYEKAP